MNTNLLFAAAVLLACGTAVSAQTSVSLRVGRIVPSRPRWWDTYLVTPLGTDATAIDGQGRAVVNQGSQASLFLPSAPNAADGSLLPLGTLGGGVSAGKAINALGHVAGYSTLSNGSYRAFLWAEGVLTDVGTLSGDYSAAAAIGDDGRIAGSSYGAEGEEHGFLWTPDSSSGTTGQMVDLGTLGGEYSEALGVGAQGEVVGFAYTPQGAFHACLWRASSMTDLGTLGGSYSQAFAVDRAGEIVGQAYLPGNAQAHACRWSGGAIQDLGNLSGNYSAALAIDPGGTWIVGTATVPSDSGFLDYHAFVVQNGTMTDLNALLRPGSGWVLQRATGVNEHGQVVGYGTLDGQPRGFLLTPR